MERHRSFVVCILLSLLLAGGRSPQVFSQADPPSQTAQQEVQRLLREFAQLQQEVAPLLREALRDPEVQEQYLAFQTFVEDKIIEINPNSRQLIEKRRKVRDRLRELQGNVQLPLSPE